MEMKMEWGTELWDKYGELCNHTSYGIEFLDSHVAAFVKERGKIESDYAKSLRALVKKYTPKENASTVPTKPDKNGPTLTLTGPVSIISLNTTQDEEYSHMTAYKQVETILECLKNCKMNLGVWFEY